MTLATWIAPKYLRNNTLSQTYKNAKPYPHIALSGFFHEEKVKLLEKALQKEQFERKESDLFKMEQTHDLTQSNQPIIREFAAFLASKEFTTFITEITGVRLKPGTIDMAGAIYRDTDYLLVHDDEVEGRKIAYILNLSKGFTKTTGGALALLNSEKKGAPKNVVKRLIPTWNTFIFFTVSSHSHHQVEEVLQDKARITIGGWLRG